MQKQTLRYAWIAIFLAVFIWSAMNPKDYPTWFLEVLPAVLGAAVLWYTRDTYPLTQLTYILILIPLHLRGSPLV
jgi:putative membrane protein